MAALWPFRQNPLVADNLVAGNSAARGGGMRFCFFYGPPEPLVRNNIVTGNTASARGGGIDAFDSDPVIWSATIESNAADSAGGGVHAGAGAAVTLINSIVAENLSAGGVFADSGGTITTDHCDVWSNVGGDYVGCSASPTDLSCDPEHCSDAGIDLHLYEVSCCQGSGSNGADIGALGVGCFTVPDVLFYDNFSDQNDDDWSVETGGDGSLGVVAGAYLGSAVSAGSWARSTVSQVAMPFLDFLYQLEFAPVSVSGQGSTGWIEFYFRYQDSSHFYLVRLDEAIGQLIRADDLGQETLAEFECALTPNEPVTLKLFAVGPLLQGFLFDPQAGDPGSQEQLLFYVDDEGAPILSGMVGVGVRSEGPGGRAAGFDDVLVAYRGSVVGAPPRGRAPADVPLALRAWPNPCSGSARIRFEVDSARRARLSVFDVRGALVLRLFDGPLLAGVHEARWEGCDAQGRKVASGVYLLRLETPHGCSGTKVLLLR